MESIFIGRVEEKDLLQKAYQDHTSRFVAVFGRRRVGKTFLVRHVLQEKFTFQMTAMANVGSAQQLLNFHSALQRQGGMFQAVPKNWFFAFQNLIDFLEASPHEKKVVFFDELPWLAAKKSDFLSSLEHFWNSWASARQDVLLVVCGSAASWMVNELIRNKGGLHNRVTDRIRLEPFTLLETEAFLHTKNPALDRYSIIQLYMVMGGVPFYLNAVSGQESAMQNIERICFWRNGVLREEFNFLLQALFSKAEQHITILDALSTKNKGLTRNQIVSATRLHNSGRLTALLTELEESGFVQSYVPFGKSKRDKLFRLSDFYTAFYFKFIRNTTILDENNWLNALESGRYQSWKGYAFEQVCLGHVRQIKRALGIQGIVSHAASWQSTDIDTGAQIDLLIDRKDRVINVFEIKFSEQPYIITQAYAAQLAHKISHFKEKTGTRKSVFLTMLTPFGVQSNAYASALVQQNMDMNVLFS
ncbi:MAG: AAA family ATPase [Thermoanaerobaculia bacterium]|nr:AAA family ATPase [Thermoanaerobaculia bacterium]